MRSTMRVLNSIAFLCCLACGLLATEATGSTAQATTEASGIVRGPLSVSFDFAHLDVPLPAGVAGGADVVFVGSPLDGRVLALSRLTCNAIGELPAPPGGFVLAFIM